MISFKTFLEAEVTPLVSTQITASKELADSIKKNCSNSLWMFKNNSPIWRGDKRALAILGLDGAAIIDTNLSSRKSENALNWYTTILDNHPEYKDYPKRSKSLICSTRWRNASNYTASQQDDVGTMALIPYNNCKIGWVGAGDIWNAKVRIDSNDDSNTETFKGMNDFLKEFEQDGLDPDNWDSFNTFSNKVKKSFLLQEKLKDVIEEYFVSDNIKAIQDNWADDFKAQILHAYSPQSTKMKLLTTSDLKNYSNLFGWMDNSTPATELWIGDGKVIALHFQTFTELRQWIV